MWNDSVEYQTVRCSSLSDERLKQCKELFDNHYGVWGMTAKNPGGRIRFPMSNYKQYCDMEHTFVALALLDDQVIGQAFYLRELFPNIGYISWVLQLVVHEAYRQQGIAKTLLQSVWGFSGDAAWGLATSNALTVKTLERATFRKADPKEIKENVAKILMLKEKIPFAAEAGVTITDERSVIDSGFPVERSIIDDNLNLYGKENWHLGELEDGQEWLAFTFSNQVLSKVTKEQYDEIFEHSEKIVNDAYNRMMMNMQPWNRHQKAEIEFVLNHIDAEQVQEVYDFGCGNGRHSFELARCGYRVTGVDYSKNNIHQASDKNIFDNLCFIQADCRTVEMPRQADLAICLYDVVGSFSNQQENKKIIENIKQYVKKGGYLAVSVMNMELTESLAKYQTKNVKDDLHSLLSLKPSNTMQTSGNIFKPDYYLLETDTGLVYRKEQFENDGMLSAEYVIRDRRYRKSEICNMLENAGFSILESRYVQAGHWNQALQAVDPKAKEILVIGKKTSD